MGDVPTIRRAEKNALPSLRVGSDGFDCFFNMKGAVAPPLKL
jgi:hypothetical protein